jgi:hypothetical protein
MNIFRVSEKLCLPTYFLWRILYLYIVTLNCKLWNHLFWLYLKIFNIFRKKRKKKKTTVYWKIFICLAETGMDWLIIYGFTSHSRIFHLWRRHHCRWRALCSALRAFEQGGIFIVWHLLWHGALVFPVSSEGPPLSVASFDTQGDVEDLFLPGSSRPGPHSVASYDTQGNTENLFLPGSSRLEFENCLGQHFFLFLGLQTRRSIFWIFRKKK